MDLLDTRLYGLVGEAGFTRLVAAFYRQIPQDDILGPMYPGGDMAGAEQRLRDFLIFRFGGPDRYIQSRGHPRLRMRHAPFAVTPAARDRWLQLMENAIAEADLPESAIPPLRQFFHATANFLVNQPAGPGQSGAPRLVAAPGRPNPLAPAERTYRETENGRPA